MRIVSRRHRAALKLFVTFVTLLGVMMLAILATAEARVGGGQSYGGGGSSSSGGGYSGGGGRGSGGGGGGGGGDDTLLLELIFHWIRFCWYYPQVGVPITLVIVVWFSRESIRDGLTSSSYRVQTSPEERRAHHSTMPKQPPRRNAFRDQLEMLRRRDPNFSVPLFKDFLVLLYSRVARARETGEVDPVRPYVSEELPKQWEGAARRRHPRVVSVDDVIVGQIDIDRIEERGKGHRITVRFETNVTETHDDGQKRTFILQETWFLDRKMGVLSKGPGAITSLGCPSCGSPEPGRADGTCRSCDQPMKPGDFHWRLEEAQVKARRPWERLRAENVSGAEVGTDLDTRFDPHLDAEKRAFAIRHPDFDPVQFQKRVENIFLALQAAWSEQRWDRARAFETDSLWNTHRFWIENYKRSKLVNKVEEVQVNGVTLVKIETDAYYEALTVRVHAQCVDYTETVDGEHVAGSRKKKRYFTEYWTFLRSAGGTFGKTSTEAGSCPSCGAPAVISQTGVCEYCNSVITTGQFDWVLSEIQQDESYKG